MRANKKISVVEPRFSSLCFCFGALIFARRNELSQVIWLCPSLTLVTDHTVAGKAKMKFNGVREIGILDHEFAGAGLERKVYVGVVPNEEGSTTTFMRPDGLTDEQFQEQHNSQHSHI